MNKYSMRIACMNLDMNMHIRAVISARLPRGAKEPVPWQARMLTKGYH